MGGVILYITNYMQYRMESACILPFTPFYISNTDFLGIKKQKNVKSIVRNFTLQLPNFFYLVLL